MKKLVIGLVTIGLFLTNGITQAKGDWIQDQQGKWEYYADEEPIENFYNKSYSDFTKPIKFPQYYQADSRWGGKRYGLSNLKITGCVPTSLAMIISELKEDVTPVQVADYIYNTSMEMNTTFTGTSSLGAALALENWGLKYRIVNSKEDLELSLKKGYIVFGIVGHGIFVKGNSTHSVILSGYHNGNTKAIDPDNMDKTDRWYNMDKIWQQRSTAAEDVVLGGAFMVVYK
ncbi:MULTISPECIES: C39 family peptidase [Gemella]|uniref:C39 family peptidase n=1 Tax=Gemella TaxID=1378 RepID=UPI0007681DA1|nr:MULTISPECIES: C39 family peptidase [Gemella]AME08710.1 N-acetylmuramidase [Gemella sp. oral taxon 928]AXI26286.1 N-acetylmuramidase [Gemella sp. ND 6198]